MRRRANASRTLELATKNVGTVLVHGLRRLDEQCKTMYRVVECCIGLVRWANASQTLELGHRTSASTAVTWQTERNDTSRY